MNVRWRFTAKSNNQSEESPSSQSEVKKVVPSPTIPGKKNIARGNGAFGGFKNPVTYCDVVPRRGNGRNGTERSESLVESLTCGRVRFRWIGMFGTGSKPELGTDSQAYSWQNFLHQPLESRWGIPHAESHHIILQKAVRSDKRRYFTSSGSQRDLPIPLEQI